MFVLRVREGMVLPYICFGVTSLLDFCSKVPCLVFRVLGSTSSLVSRWTSSVSMVFCARELYRLVSLVKFDIELHVLRSNCVKPNHDLVHGVEFESRSGTTYTRNKRISKQSK